jgi:hypothetical protein
VSSSHFTRRVRWAWWTVRAYVVGFYAAIVCEIKGHDRAVIEDDIGSKRWVYCRRCAEGDLR